VKEASLANSEVLSFFSTHTSEFLWRRKYPGKFADSRETVLLPASPVTTRNCESARWPRDTTDLPSATKRPCWSPPSTSGGDPPLARRLTVAAGDPDMARSYREVADALGLKVPAHEGPLREVLEAEVQQVHNYWRRR
jgi:hypothetical protein